MDSTKAVFFCFLALIGTSWFSGGGSSGLSFAMPGYSTKQNYEQTSLCGYQIYGQNDPCRQQTAEQGNFDQQSYEQYEGSNHQLSEQDESSYPQAVSKYPGQQNRYQQPAGQFTNQQTCVVLRNPDGKYIYLEPGLVFNPIEQQKPVVVVLPTLPPVQSTTKDPYEGRPVLRFFNDVHQIKMNALNKWFHH